MPNHPVGTVVSVGECLPPRESYLLPYRVVGLHDFDSDYTTHQTSSIETLAETRESMKVVPTLSSLGIVEEDLRQDDDRFPLIRGRGLQAETLAVCEMVALSLNVPFRRDVIAKVLQDQIRRNKDLSIEVIGGLAELQHEYQIAEIDSQYISVETPAILFWKYSVILWQQMMA